MTAETALKFAKVCMGWEDAKLVKRRFGYKIYSKGYALFDHPDWYAVIGAVKVFCDKHQLEPCLKRVAGAKLVIGEIKAPLWTIASAGRVSPCQSLMEACIAAAEKMEGV